MNPVYRIILTQGIKFLLRSVALYLGYIGVSVGDQNKFVEVSTPLVFGIVVALGVELWCYLEKKGLPVIIREALAAHPNTPLDEVVTRAKKKSKFVPSIKHLSLLIIFSLFLTACPARSDLVKAFKASEQLAVNTETAALAIGDLYQGKVITFEQKESLIAKLRIIAINGKRFHAEVKALAGIYKSKLPDEKISALDIMFNSEVITPFLEILLDAKVLSKEASQKVFLVLAVLRTAVLTISNAFGKRLSYSVSYEFYKENSVYA